MSHKDDPHYRPSRENEKNNRDAITPLVRDTFNKQASLCPCTICPQKEGCNTICRHFRTYVNSSYTGNQKRTFQKLKVKWMPQANQSGTPTGTPTGTPSGTPSGGAQ